MTATNQRYAGSRIKRMEQGGPTFDQPGSHLGVAQGYVNNIHLTNKTTTNINHDIFQGKHHNFVSLVSAAVAADKRFDK